MGNEAYKSFRDSELKSIYSDFDFADIMKKAAGSDYWKNKTALWTIISGACNDAAGQWYTKMREYVQNLVDIETCNIFALKSMAKSIDAEYLTSFINDSYPKEILDLINLFSINKNLLFEQFKFLHSEANAPLIGAIDLRNQVLTITKYYTEIIYEIFARTSDIQELLLKNNVPLEVEKDTNESNVSNELDPESPFLLKNILKVMNTSEDEDALWNTIFKLPTTATNITEFYFIYKNEKKEAIKSYITEEELKNRLDLKTILDNIDLINNYEIDIKNFVEANAYICVKDTNDNDVWYLNPFHIIISVLRNLLWNPFLNTFFNTSYYNKENSVLIDCTNFYYKIIEIIQNYDENYLNDFITFHFYGLIFDKLINMNLINDWNWAGEIPYFVSTKGDYTREEFETLITDYVTDSDKNIIITNLTNYKKTHVDFFRYLYILNDLLIYNDHSDPDIDKENIQFSITKENQQNTFFILNRFNNELPFDSTFNSEKRRLLRI
jgi:hypothetical protein